MLESCESAQERWGGVHKIIDKWLNERQELLVLYVAIQGLKPFSSRETPVSVKIQAFCQVLMDYCSAGHFEVYEQLIKEAEEFITSECVAFNDAYQTAENCIEKIADLSKDLSALGELLEERFEIEDSLIEALHTSHKEMVA